MPDTTRRSTPGRATPALLALAGLLAAAPAFAQADAPAADGQTSFNNSCRTCHALNEGDHRLGPSLAGVVGREAGSVEGYGFSSALARADFTWDEARLDAFIENPDAVVPGHNMKPFPGITNADERALIVQFLASGG
ncbi:c-type cytochrome [Methylobrevis albus]|uniref:C-type cytochrome n=1 Tax=Methylobrevis albus TaxID=2793297 RepID=A0A931I415_9HYPH|nr:c-type cytochrome [Methylobrevis albus]MBH0238468.1 c-type cytochrome [Methylobrevis albus]